MEQTLLVKRLASLDGGPALLGHLLALERSVNDLLSYIPATFPHYTRHTLPHSVEIVEQIGRIVLDGGGWAEAAELNAVEIYVVCCAALLHDAGMVASESEQAAILASEAWADFIARYASSTWEQITTTLESPGVPMQERFLALVELRRLIAEHLRRLHHVRSAVFTLGAAPLPEFWVGDKRLRRAVADICESHGLSHDALSDGRRFPTQTDLLGEPVDVRFLAILLRLGDLLDLSHDRACPLTAWAAGTLPEGSAIHWDQFDVIRHRTTTTRRIEIIAECEDEGVYRVLRDWCRWIVDETTSAHALLARSPRHSTWHAPLATMGVAGATIEVCAAPGADFIPSDWRLSVDAGLVVERFMSHVHQDQLEGVILELVQNAVDATRCRAIAEAPMDTPSAPPYALPESHRRAYPISIGLYEEETRQADGSTRRVQWLEIVDHGIGMDADDVTTYLLQVGRSFYQTRRFREQYRFAPAGQFGVGFLTVFGLSSFVEVETLKRGGDEPVHVTITGPNDYVIRRPSSRTETGTLLRIRIDRPVRPGLITKHVQRFSSCEFPLDCTEDGVTTVVFDEVRARRYPNYTEAEFSEHIGTTFGLRVDLEELSGWITVEGYRRDATIVLEPPRLKRRTRWIEEESYMATPIAWRAELRTHRLRDLPEDDLHLWGVKVPRGSSITSSIHCTAQIDYRPTRGARSALTLDRRAAKPMYDRVRRGLAPVLDEFFLQYLTSQPQIAVQPEFMTYRQSLAEDFFWVPAVRELPVLEVLEASTLHVRSITELRARELAVAVHSRIATGDLLPLWDDADQRLRDHGIEPEYTENTADWTLLNALMGAGRLSPAAEVLLPDSYRLTLPLVSVAQLANIPNALRQHLFDSRPLVRVERLEDDWWQVVYASDEGTTPASRSALARQQFGSVEAAVPNFVPFINCSDRMLCITRPVPESHSHLLPDTCNTVREGDASPMILNPSNVLGGWLVDALRNQKQFDSLESASTVRDALIDLIYDAAVGRRKGVRRLNAGLNELRAMASGFGVVPPPPVQVLRHSTLGLLTRAHRQ